MATIKVIFRATRRNPQEGSLCFRVIHNRRVRQLNTGNKIMQVEWDNAAGKVTPGSSGQRSEYLRKVCGRLNDGMTRLAAIVADLDKSGSQYSVEDVVDRYNAPGAVVGFLSFARNHIANLVHSGKTRLAEHYTTSLNSFIRFHGNTEIPFEVFDATLMARYESHLKALGLTPNTNSYYMRNLRAIYNRAVENEIAPRANPFRHVYTGVAKTVKRAVTIDTIKALRRMDMTLDPAAELARDLFLFSFYTRGMAIIDVANLRKSCLKNGALTYRRQKTGQQLSIRWEPQMQEIVSRHANRNSEFMFPLIDSCKPDYRRQYLTAYAKINRCLKKIGKQLGLAQPLTFHRARHAWASIARDNNVPIAVICEGMGHDSEKTTRIYLASLDSSLVDNANSDIIRLLE